MQESVVATLAIRSVSACGSDQVRDEDVFLVVTGSKQVEHTRVGIVTDGLQDHVVTLLDCAETHIFHSLHKGQSAAVSLLRFLLKMLVQSVFLVYVVACPEVHGQHPGDGELGHASPNVRALVEKLRSPLLVKVSVLEHGRVRVEVSHATASLGALLAKQTWSELLQSNSKHKK